METTTIVKKTWEPVDRGSYETCPVCDEIIESDSEWLGEDDNGRGWYYQTDRCPYGCGHQKYRRPE